MFSNNIDIPRQECSVYEHYSTSISAVICFCIFVLKINEWDDILHSFLERKLQDMTKEFLDISVFISCSNIVLLSTNMYQYFHFAIIRITWTVYLIYPHHTLRSVSVQQTKHVMFVEKIHVKKENISLYWIKNK